MTITSVDFIECTPMVSPTIWLRCWMRNGDEEEGGTEWSECLTCLTCGGGGDVSRGGRLRKEGSNGSVRHLLQSSPVNSRLRVSNKERIVSYFYMFVCGGGGGGGGGGTLPPTPVYNLYNCIICTL